MFSKPFRAAFFILLFLAGCAPTTSASSRFLSAITTDTREGGNYNAAPTALDNVKTTLGRRSVQAAIGSIGKVYARRCLSEAARAIGDFRRAEYDMKEVSIAGADLYFCARGSNDASRRGICGAITAKTLCHMGSWVNSRASDILQELFQRLVNGEDGHEYEGGNATLKACSYGRQMTPWLVWNTYGKPLDIDEKYQPRGMS